MHLNPRVATTEVALGPEPLLLWSSLAVKQTSRMEIGCGSHTFSSV
jgi:hypothetical protein